MRSGARAPLYNMHTTVATKAGRREWIGLAVLALPTLLISIDTFVLLLALPVLSTDLGASGTQTLWIMDSYGFLLAGFLITMGTLGDRIGRRRLLLLGGTAFTVVSVLAAYSPNAETLVLTRALLGIAGATLMPSTMALISNMFTDARQRAVAFSVWMVCFMSGAAVGPLVGGMLLEHFWWGSVFLLGVPLMIPLLLLGPVLLPEYRDPAPGRIDLVSVALSLAAILPFVYGLKEIAQSGVGAGPSAALAIGVAFGVAFVGRQRRLASPLVDLRLFADRAFRSALGILFASTLTLGAIVLFVTQYLQVVEGLSPFVAGLWLLPTVLTSTVGALLAPILARRWRPAYVIGGGIAVGVLGLLIMATAGGLAAVVIGFAVVNLGGCPMAVLGTDLIVSSAPVEKAGSAAALNETGGEFGFALGIAALGSVGALVFRHELPAHDSVTGAVVAADGLPPEAGASLLAEAQSAFTSGMHVAALLAAVLLAVVALVVVPKLRHLPPL